MRKRILSTPDRKKFDAKKKDAGADFNQEISNY